MKAMVLEGADQPLVARNLPDPLPGPGQLLIDIRACGVCRTDLHVLDGELPALRYPLIPGHEIVGTVAALGTDVTGFRPGERVGVPWLGHTCGSCPYCSHGQENLCDSAGFTGYTLPGGYAEQVVADSHFCFALPGNYSDAEAAPLLCAGLIGFRAWRAAGAAARLGIYGFGAAAHLIAQVAIAAGQEVYAFTRPGDTDAQRFARELGATWAGDSDTAPPQALDAAIIFAPNGALVPQALRQLRRGGRVVCAGIHMSDIPSFPYDLLWGERSICSVANLTRQDGLDFLALAGRVKLQVATTVYPLAAANRALDDLRHGRFVGAAVLEVQRSHGVA